MKYLWEILVPTMMINIHAKLVPVRTRHHRVWDSHVRKISGGLTILTPAKGQWISSSGALFSERMIPVRIMCTEKEINLISDLVAKHYNQEAVMYYKVSDNVVIRTYNHEDS